MPLLGASTSSLILHPLQFDILFELTRLGSDAWRHVPEECHGAAIRKAQFPAR